MTGHIHFGVWGCSNTKMSTQTWAKCHKKWKFRYKQISFYLNFILAVTNNKLVISCSFLQKSILFIEQGWFQVCAQPMRDCVTLKQRLSLAGGKPGRIRHAASFKISVRIRLTHHHVYFGNRKQLDLIFFELIFAFLKSSFHFLKGKLVAPRETY